MENKYLEKYQKVENNFFNFLDSRLSNELLFYSVTGSLARKNIIANWSDIDILIVFNEYNEKIFKTLTSALKNNNSNIKIGTTFYSIDEFVSKNIFKDPKTVCALELIKKGVFEPRKCDKIVFNKIEKLINPSFDYWSRVISFTMILHEYKRALIPYADIDEKKVYKSLNTLLKILLKQKGIEALNYEDVLKGANSYLEGFNFDIVLPEIIIEDKNGISLRKKEYIKILNWLKKYKYA